MPRLIPLQNWAERHFDPAPAIRTPPTYHEIRSLAERLYRAQGIDTQALLGHRHARMTEVYADPRQAEWLKVR